LTRKILPPVTTGQIYWGAVPFVVIQIVMISLVIAFPQMVLVYKAGEKKIDIKSIQIIVPEEQPFAPGAPDGSKAAPPSGSQEQEQAEEALERAMGVGGGQPPKSEPKPNETAPGANEQDDATKALERALRGPGEQKAP